MKLTISTLLTLSLCLQTGLTYSMQQVETKLTAEQRAAAADAKQDSEKIYTLCNPDKNLGEAHTRALPDPIRKLTRQFAYNHWADFQAIFASKGVIQSEGLSSARVARIDANRVVIGYEAAIVVFDTTGTQQLLQLPEQQEAILSLIKIDDNTIAFNVGFNTIRLWDISSNKLISEINLAGCHGLVNFSDRYMITHDSDARNLVAIDIEDRSTPKLIKLESTSDIDSQSKLLDKVSDTEIIYASFSGITVLDISDIEKPVARSITKFEKNAAFPQFSPRTLLNANEMACIRLPNSPIFIITNQDGSLDYYDITTLEKLEHIKLGGRASYASHAILLSPRIFIALTGSGLYICSADDPQLRDVVLARVPYQFNRIVKLSDTRFLTIDSDLLRVYNLDENALKEYEFLSICDHRRLSHLIRCLNRLTLDNFAHAHDKEECVKIAKAFFNKIPATAATIKKNLRHNYPAFETDPEIVSLPTKKVKTEA